MSFGALGKNAILALNHGARLGRFANNTGEGDLSAYHVEPGGDLVWQIGTGYFGCRTPAGDFDPARGVGIDVRDKSRRVARYHEATVKAFRELAGAAGLDSPEEIRPHHVLRQVDAFAIRHFGETYPFPPEGFLLDGAAASTGWAEDWDSARSGKGDKPL